MTAHARFPWGLYRKPDGTLTVGYKAFAEPALRLLSSHVSRPGAAAALEAQERADKVEAQRPRVQGSLLEGGE